MAEDEKNKNVAEDEYTKYTLFMDTYAGSLLGEMFPEELVECILEYTKMDECEHFEAVIGLDPRMFGFAWAYNELYAQRNWLHDLQPYGLFVPPEHITPASILMFNEWPHKMFLFARLHDDYELLDDKNEDDIVASFKYCASIITARPPGIAPRKNTRTRYRNICVQKHTLDA